MLGMAGFLKANNALIHEYVLVGLVPQDFFLRPLRGGLG